MHLSVVPKRWGTGHIYTIPEYQIPNCGTEIVGIELNWLVKHVCVCREPETMIPITSQTLNPKP